MTKTIIFGNSGSGKSTLAKSLSREQNTAHLDLDTIAWLATTPPSRQALADSKREIDAFITSNSDWVIEGCYADLLELALPSAEQLIFLNLPIESCVENAKARPWEPHKYETKQAQDKNLDMLIAWIQDYKNRSDTFSKQAHLALYETFSGNKIMYTSNRQ